jgi:alpha-tubulin suppressor-like RCC1 family protein
MNRILCGIFAFSVISQVFGQGHDLLINYTPNSLVAPIYGPAPSDPSLALTGNGPEGFPAGNQIYSGRSLEGTNWLVQLFAATGVDQPEAALHPGFPTTTVGSGATAGHVRSETVTFPEVPSGPAIVTLQLRAWDNSSSLYPAWTDLMAAVEAGIPVAYGQSLTFTKTGLNGGGYFVESGLKGLRSFNVHYRPLSSNSIIPVILIQPSSQKAYLDASPTLQVVAAASVPLSYQWLKDGVNLPDANDMYLRLSNVQSNSAGTYSVLVSTTNASVLSAPAVLTIVPQPPIILANPTSRTLGARSNATFTVAATGTPPLSYQWSKDGSTIPGGTDASLTVTMAQSLDTGFYSVLVTNPYGSAISSNVFLNVVTPNVIAWGDNSVGQVAVPLSATNVIALAAGQRHTVALCKDGRVLAWGYSESIRVPSSATNIVAIAAAGSYNLALRKDGTVLVWGAAPYEIAKVPTNATNLIAIAASHTFAMGLQADGHVVIWGTNYFRGATTRVPVSVSNVVAIAAGSTPRELVNMGFDFFPRAQLRDGSVILWNPDVHSSYELVLPAAWHVQQLAESFYFPVDSALLTLAANGKVTQTGVRRVLRPPALTNAVWITAHSNFFAAIKTDGTISTWGNSPLANVPAFATNAISLVASAAHAASVTALPEPPQLLGPFQTTYSSDVSVGSPLPLFIRAVGSQPLHYQWMVDGSLVPDSDSPFPQITAALGPKDVECQVIVSNPYGSVTSVVAKVTVRSANVWGSSEYGLNLDRLKLTNAASVAAGTFHWLGLTPTGEVFAGGKNRDGQASVPAGLGTVVQVAAGGDHSLALKADATIAAWGRNQDGQTTVPLEVTNIVMVSAGWAHSLALRDDGRVYAWGNNEYGQTDTPGDLEQVISVAAGYYHSMALCSDGTIRTWGLDAPVPASATGVVQISAGRDHCLALRADGSVIGWGDNSNGQTSIPASATGIVAIAAGYYHDLALRSDGSVVTWGRPGRLISELPRTNFFTAITLGEDFSIAIMSEQAPQFRPQRTRIIAHAADRQILTASVSGTPPLSLQWYYNASSIGGATNRSLILDGLGANDAGSYVLVASNAFGHTASPPVELTIAQAPYVRNSFSRRAVPIGGDVSLEAVVTGAEPITYQWLWNGNPLTSDLNFSGVHSRVLTLSNAQFAQSGTYSVTVSNAQGSLTRPIAKLVVSEIIAWGDNSAGQLDVPETATNILMIAAGDRHNLAVRADGEIIGWGDDNYGQASPPSSATNIVAVAAGQNHSLALTADGKVLAWGDNSFGQSTVPFGLDTAVAVAAGNAHSLALKLDGSVVAWGSFGLTNVPTAISNVVTIFPRSLSNIIAIAAGDWSTVALRGNGTAVRFYYGNSRQQSLTGIRAIAAGANHALVLRENGEIIGWGGNYYGQATVPAMSSMATAISAGGDHSLALLEDASIVAWGANYSGENDVPSIDATVSAISAGGSHNLALIGQPRLPLTLSTPMAQVSGDITHILLRIDGLTGTGPAIIYQSPDCLSWSPLYTNAPSFGRIQFVDHHSTPGAPRFYRVSERR